MCTYVIVEWDGMGWNMIYECDCVITKVLWDETGWDRVCECDCVSTKVVVCGFIASLNMIVAFIRRAKGRKW